MKTMKFIIVLKELTLKSPSQNRVQVTPWVPDCPYHLASYDKLLLSQLYWYLQAPN